MILNTQALIKVDKYKRRQLHRYQPGCHCPPQLEGPDCQQTRLSFLGNGYAWFPPIRPCFDSHLSLEFMTEEEDGLLLYAGPLATLLPGDAEDYMAI
ncbi:neural-cadherin-like protein, partial [Lates japonicus]